MDSATVLSLVVAGLSRGSIYVLMSLGLALIWGVLRIVNFAQGEFYMLGAYAAYFLLTLFGVSPPVAIITSAFLLFCIGALSEKALILPLRRIGGREWLLNSLVLTLGLSLILQNLALYFWGSMHRGVRYYWKGVVNLFLGTQLSLERVLLVSVTLLLVVTYWLFLQKTKIGKGIRAVADNEEAARASGINIDFIYTISFGVSAALAGFAGSLLLPITLAFPTVGQQPLYMAFIVVCLSGLKSVKGPTLGGFLLGLIESFAAFFLGAGWNRVISMALVILALLIRPIEVEE